MNTPHLKVTKRVYIVPVDAPNPSHDESGFMRTSISVFFDLDYGQKKGESTPPPHHTSFSYSTSVTSSGSIELKAPTAATV